LQLDWAAAAAAAAASSRQIASLFVPQLACLESRLSEDYGGIKIKLITETKWPPVAGGGKQQKRRPTQRTALAERVMTVEKIANYK